VSSKLLEERQAEMRQRRLQEKANRKKHQFALEPKGVSFSRNAAPDEPQVESESLEKARVESAIERHPNGSTTVSRDDLYTLVWTEAMTTVAARFGVSANYLARVCEYLNVPHPNRGYWAKLTVGKAAKRPPLPAARPGEVLQWTKGTGVPRENSPSVATIEKRTGRLDGTSTSDRPVRHQLVANVREFFEAGRLSEVGYLRPFKRNLVDIFVSRETLSYALDTANELFMAFEDRGHRVTLASMENFIGHSSLSKVDQNPSITTNRGVPDAKR
jgi:hypothetical protein